MGISTAIGIGSSLLGARNASKAAKAQQAAADAQAQVQRENAERAAEAAKFRAVGFTSPYATPTFDVNEEGQLTNISTELSPELQSRFDRLGTAAEGLFGTGLERALDTRRQDLADQYFGLGQQQLASLQLDPMQAAAERTSRMQELLAPQRAAQQEQLFSDLASKGLTGLAVDQGTGQQVNPYAAALAQTQAQQDRQIAAESLDLADEQIANQLQRATGLFGTAAQQEALQAGQAAQALTPYETLFGAGQDIYNLGQAEQARAYDISDLERQRAIAAASQQANFMTSAGDIQANAANRAAQQRFARQQGLLTGLQGLDYSGLGGMFGGGGAAGTSYTPSQLKSQYTMYGMGR